MQLVIFDLDGVIVSTDLYHFKAWKSIADENNLLFSYKINHMLRGVSRAESLKIILDINGVNVQPEQFERMMEKKNKIYIEKLEELTEKDILTGALDLINGLKKNKIKIAVGSSSKNTSLILNKIGLKNDFDAVIDGNKIENSKPNPEVFLKCAKALDVSPSDCVVIEDAKAGIDAARRAGMIAISVGSEGKETAHLTVENLRELNYEKINEVCTEKNG